MALQWIRRARDYYTHDLSAQVSNNNGMCWCFYVTCPWYLDYDFRSTRHFLSVLIPEFNFNLMTSLFPSDLDISSQSPSGFWWSVSDYRSRVSAFDYLVRIYEANLSMRSYFKW